MGRKTSQKSKSKETYISNLACPYCGHIITDKDLEDWRCIKCGKSFTITYEKSKSTQPNKKKKIKIKKEIS